MRIRPAFRNGAAAMNYVILMWIAFVAPHARACPDPDWSNAFLEVSTFLGNPCSAMSDVVISQNPDLSFNVLLIKEASTNGQTFVGYVRTQSNVVLNSIEVRNNSTSEVLLAI